MWTEEEIQQEIAELTGQLRSEPFWHDARSMLLENGHNPEEILLLNFMESEECLEWGLVLTPDDRVLQWEVDTNNGYHYKSISEKAEKEFLNYGDAVKIGRAMVAKQLI